MDQREVILCPWETCFRPLQNSTKASPTPKGGHCLSPLVFSTSGVEAGGPDKLGLGEGENNPSTPPHCTHPQSAMGKKDSLSRFWARR